MGGTDKGSSGGHKLVEVTGRNSLAPIYTARWSDGTTLRYPFVWLQDNCRCPRCYQPSCYQRLSLMKDLDPEMEPTGEEITDGGNVLKVTWKNNHIGEYPSSWLRQHRFDKGRYDPISDIKARPWGVELANEIPRFKVSEVLENDNVLLAWLSALHEVGIALLTDAPTVKGTGTMKLIGKRVAYLRRTNYGETADIYAKANASSLAYTSVELGLHVDLPFYDFCPGVQLFHCIRQTKTTGGENEFSDAYNAVLVLKRDHPEAYQLLRTVEVSFRNCGVDNLDRYHYIMNRPMIEEDRDGNFKQIYYNDQVRASYMNIPLEKIQDVYRAIKLLHQTLYQHKVVIKLKEGEIVTFNNTRVMHGRVGFIADTSSADLIRHYEGGFLDWDEVYSRMRVLKEKREGELRV